MLAVGLVMPLPQFSKTSNTYCGNSAPSTLTGTIASFLLIVSPIIVYLAFYLLFHSISRQWLRLLAALLAVIVIALIWFAAAWIIMIKSCGLVPGGF